MPWLETKNIEPDEKPKPNDAQTDGRRQAKPKRGFAPLLGAAPAFTLTLSI